MAAIRKIPTATPTSSASDLSTKVQRQQPFSPTGTSAPLPVKDDEDCDGRDDPWRREEVKVTSFMVASFLLSSIYYFWSDNGFYDLTLSAILFSCFTGFMNIMIVHDQAIKQPGASQEDIERAGLIMKMRTLAVIVILYLSVTAMTYLFPLDSSNLTYIVSVVLCSFYLVPLWIKLGDQRKGREDTVPEKGKHEDAADIV